MFDRILVPIDGSALSEGALTYAAHLARSGGSSLVLMRAALGHLFSTAPDADQQAVTSDAEAELAVVADRLRREGLAVDQHLVFDDPAPAILRSVEQYGADSIVMTTHGRSGLNRLIYGSVAEKVLHHAPVPVVLIAANCEVEWTSTSTDARRWILVPLDGSEIAESALEPAEILAARLDADLLLLQSVPPPVVVTPEAASAIVVDLEVELEAARSYLDEVAERRRASGRTVETLSLFGSPFVEIIDVAEARGAIAIAMATHGRTGLTHLVLGSVAEGVVKHGRRPVLLIRPEALRTISAD